MKTSMMIVLCVVFFNQLLIAEEKKDQKNDSLNSWVGVYTSPSEIGGYSYTVLGISESPVNEEKLSYRMVFDTDVISANSIDQDEFRGDIEIEDDKLFIPMAHGRKCNVKNKEEILLRASIDKYTLLEINGKKLLMREDALKSYKIDNKLNDYGILIKISDKFDVYDSLKESKHESIKVLYNDKNKKWSDPFVNGPNER